MHNALRASRDLELREMFLVKKLRVTSFIGSILLSSYEQTSEICALLELT